MWAKQTSEHVSEIEVQYLKRNKSLVIKAKDEDNIFTVIFISEGIVQDLAATCCLCRSEIFQSMVYYMNQIIN